MKIMTNDGREYDIRVICTSMRNKNTVLIELDDDRPLAQIAADFDGLESFIKCDEAIEGVFETYEGFCNLISIQRNKTAGTVRIAIGKGD